MFLLSFAMLLWTPSHRLPFPFLAPAKVTFPETPTISFLSGRGSR